MNKKQKGFTLVELMIVVAIIGILAAVAIPKFADMLEKSREGATKGYVSAMKSAVANYLADNQGQIPYTLDSATWIDPSTGQSYPPYVAGNTEAVAALMSSYMDNIPNVKVTSKSKANSDWGKGPGQGPNSTNVSYTWHPNMVAPAVPGAAFWPSSALRGASIASGKGWRYDRTSGAIWVNSQELDMAGRSYTMFGFD